MTKKGGVQQLQADLHTDEDFEKFIERPGLLVLDVYSDWCGPCLGMVGSLKKIKLELGGDNLHLAIAKSDTISYLKRFHKKSEPTWLFITHGKAVNLMFGTNVPKLMKLIANELQLLISKQTRHYYELTELQPEEVQRQRVKEQAIADAERAERNEKEKKRRDYLNYVTDTIIDNLPDIGVTIFGPQVNRDMFKKIMEPADALKIQCKDRRVISVSKENFEVINYACKNPLSEEVIDILDQKELLVCFWKMPEDSRAPVEDVLAAYAHELTRTRTEPADEFNEEERVIPPIITPLDVKIEVELEDGEEYEEEDNNSIGAKSTKSHKSMADPGADADADLEGAEGEYDEDEEGDIGEGEAPEMPELPIPLDMDLDLMDDDGSDVIEREPEIVIEEPPKKRTRMKTIQIPPIWVANNHRTHAALIYTFFRTQTAPFLPPDPIPEPPHIIMAFDAYKKKDLISLAQRNKDDVPLFGFFTSDDPDEAKFIANSAQKYASQQHTPGDKIVFKVNKQTSHTMLSLATYGPSYVSANTVLGREEALKFFPENYKTAEQEALEMQQQEIEEPKKKRKSKPKKTVRTSVVSESDAPRTSGVSAAENAEITSPTPSGEEDTPPTTSGEESGDSMPPTTEVEGGDGAAAAAETAETPATTEEPPPEVANETAAVEEATPQPPPTEGGETTEPAQ